MRIISDLDRLIEADVLDVEADHAAPGETAKVVDVRDQGDGTERYIFQLADGTQMMSEPVVQKRYAQHVHKDEEKLFPDSSGPHAPMDDLEHNHDLGLDSPDKKVPEAKPHDHEHGSGESGHVLEPEDLSLLMDGLTKLVDEHLDPESQVRVKSLLDAVQDMPDRARLVEAQMSVKDFLDGLEDGGYWNEYCPECRRETPHPDGKCRNCESRDRDEQAEYDDVPSSRPVKPEPGQGLSPDSDEPIYITNDFARKHGVDPDDVLVEQQDGAWMVVILSTGEQYIAVPAFAHGEESYDYLPAGELEEGEDDAELFI